MIAFQELAWMVVGPEGLSAPLFSHKNPASGGKRRPVSRQCVRFGGGKQKGDEMDDLDHCLYRHYDADGVLLYVGISLSIGTRTSAHRRAAPWFRDVARIEVQHFTSRADCALAERVAIHKEKPMHNRNRANVSMADLVAVVDELPPRGMDVRPTPYAGTRAEQATRAAFDAVDFSK